MEKAPHDNGTTPFRLPITYLESCKTLPATVCDNLELRSQHQSDPEVGETKTMYDYIFVSAAPYAQTTAKLWHPHYTTDTDFLEDTQRIITAEEEGENGENGEEDIAAVYAEFGTAPDAEEGESASENDGITAATNRDFHDKYNYVPYNRIKFLNNHEGFLQILSLYLLASPVFALLTPVFILIVPFLLLKLKGQPVSVAGYVLVLKTVFAKIPIGRIFTLSSANMSEKVYTLISCSFYVFQMYQNVMACYKFNANRKHMRAMMLTVKRYAGYVQRETERFLRRLATHATAASAPYTPFAAKLREVRDAFAELEQSVTIKDHEHLYQTGKIMREFYRLKTDPTVSELMRYSFGFLGYLQNLRDLKATVAGPTLQLCTFATGNSKGKPPKHTKFKESKYLPLAAAGPGTSLVGNTISLRKNYVISGPNATGKTTLVKSTLLNTVLCQQFGAGCFTKATVVPVDHFHCYINIPDTSGRDSLFQAEARQCKEILDQIAQSPPGARHLCVFDELFSGTNPYEAAAAGHGYLSYLAGVTGRNVRFFLTTHYLDLCESLSKNATIKNHNTDARFTLRRGISTSRGGIAVLRQFNYPEPIIQMAEKKISLN